MNIKINQEAVNQAISLLEDEIFKLTFDSSDPKQLGLMKLVRMLENNKYFKEELALMICGESNKTFPYRSSYYLTQFFSDLNLDFEHDGTTRRFWVKKVLDQLSINDLATVIEKGLFNKRDYKRLINDDEDVEKRFLSAKEEFKQLVKDSFDNNSDVDLTELLDLNINLELLSEMHDKTSDNQLDELINEAKRRFYDKNDKQVAIEKLWDAFERLKTYYDSDKKKSSQTLLTSISGDISLIEFENEFADLTKIGNEYRIRHHETNKKPIVDPSHINYLFFRMLSLLNLCLTKIARP